MVKTFLYDNSNICVNLARMKLFSAMPTIDIVFRIAMFVYVRICYDGNAVLH